MRDGRHYANQPARPLWLLRRRPNFRRFQHGEGLSKGLLRDYTSLLPAATPTTNLGRKLLLSLGQTLPSLQPGCGCGVQLYL